MVSYIINFRWGATKKYKEASGIVALYESSDFNTSNEISRKNLSHGTDRDSYDKGTLRGMANIKNNILYVYYCGKAEDYWTSNQYVGFYDMYMNLTYPDTTILYL